MIPKPRCKPGDLCLVIQGPSCGQTLTVERLAPLSEVLSVLQYATGNSDSRIHDSECGDVFWKSDKPIKWANPVTGRTIDIPYEWDSVLLPIQPPADMKLDSSEFESPLQFSWETTK